MKKIFLTLSLLSCFSLYSNESEEDIARLARKAQAIIVKAKKDWPENYALQIKQIECETQAMRAMDNLSKQMKVPD